MNDTKHSQELTAQSAVRSTDWLGPDRFRLLNKTTMRDVIDADSDDGSPAEFSEFTDAVQALQRVNDLKRLNPAHANDEVTIYKLTRP